MKSPTIAYALLAVLVLSQAAPPASAIDIGTTSAYREQRFEAWGTSLAWMGHELGGSSNDLRREQIMDLLFDQNNGLGLNYVRYNIGAHQNPAGPTITRPGADLDGWVPDAPTSITNTSTWQWDWNADSTQRSILNKSIERGVTQVEAFANSAPWWMTIAQSSTGNPAGGANLDTDYYDEFGEYLLDVAEHFQNNLGIQFNTLSPMNEPGAGWWTGGGSQEGMNIPAGGTQSSLIREIGQQIIDRDYKFGLVGPEETSERDTVNSYSQFGTLTRSYLARINTHAYPFRGGSDPADAIALHDYNASRSDPKTIYQNEYGTGSNSTPLNGGLRLANQIQSDLRNLKASGWTYWQAVEDNNGSNWGLIIAPFDGNNNWFNLRRQYYAMQQFSAFIRPGAQILDQTHEETTAAYDARTDTTTLVITNNDTATAVNSYSLVDKSAEFTRIVRTYGTTETFKALGPVSVNAGQINVSALGESITTIVVHHKPNLIENATFSLEGSFSGSNRIDGWEIEGGRFYDTNDNTNNSSGAGSLWTDTQATLGQAFQEGIGDADVDLTGQAFELSMDVKFLEAGSSNYDADTYLAIEFYGADDQTLTHASGSDFQTLIIPALGIDETQGVDSDYRTYRSGRFVAPAGTRYVRPVIRYEDVTSSSNERTYFDNAYLAVAHPTADAREWNVTGDGDWADHSNWMNHALTEKNANQYFGNAIEQASSVTINSTEVITEATFFSEHEYHLQGTGKLELGGSRSREAALLDARLGSHRISLETEVAGSTEIQVLPGASLAFEGGFDLGGQLLWKLGAGVVDFASGFEMNGGAILSYLSPGATMTFGPDAVLNGALQLLLAPGQSLELGNLFEIASYTTLNDTFDNLILPTLASGFEWDVNYGTGLLTAEVVLAVLDGDFNADGVVDGADYTVWRDNLGSPDESVLMGAGDGLNGVDQADYFLWSNNFGATAATNLATARIPEPSSALLLLLGAAAFSRWPTAFRAVCRQ